MWKIPNPNIVKKMHGEQELISQPNHSFSDGTNLSINKKISNKNGLQLLLAKLAEKNSFDFPTMKSYTKYLKVKCTSRIFAWMLQ